MKKKLTRNEDKKIIAGVMYGLAEYFDQDPVLFRLLAIIVVLLTGFFPGVVLYLVAWVLIPEKGGASSFDYDMKE